MLGALKTCQLINAVQGTPSAGGESIGANPQRIDIRYKQLRYRVLGGTWTAWHVGQFTCISAGYGITIYAFDDYLVKEL